MDRKRKIIILGDSFTFGHGCSDRIYYFDHEAKKFVGDYGPIMRHIPSEYCWPALMQRDCPSLEVVNLAKPGHCNTAMFRDLTDYAAGNDINAGDILLLNGTHPDRIEVAMDGYKKPVSWVIGWDHQAIMENEFDYNKAKKMYIKYLYDEQIGINYTLLTLLGSYGFASANNLKFTWSFPIYDKPINTAANQLGREFLQTIPENILPYRISHITSFDFSGKNDYNFNQTCRCIDYHVNDKGHLIYYEKQIKPLIESLLNT